MQATSSTSRSHFYVLLLLFTALSTLACLGAGSSGEGDSCQGSLDCADGLECAAFSDGGGVCASTCELDSVLCEDGSVCVPFDGGGGGICQVEALSGSRGPGEECSSNRDCVVGASCVGLSGVGGRCWMACDPSLSAGCGETERCREYGTQGQGSCQPALNHSCDSSDPCPATLTCGLESRGEVTFGEERNFEARCIAEAECSTDSDCPGDSVCREAHGQVFMGAENSWLEYSAEESPQRYCYQTCAESSLCAMFSTRLFCLTPADCDSFPEQEACSTFLEGDSLCITGLSAF